MNCNINGYPPIIWIIQYSNNKRLIHTTRVLKDGNNFIDFETHAEAKLFRIAIRFSGTGSLSMRDLMLFKQDES